MMMIVCFREWRDHPASVLSTERVRWELRDCETAVKHHSPPYPFSRSNFGHFVARLSQYIQHRVVAQKVACNKHMPASEQGSFRPRSKDRRGQSNGRLRVRVWRDELNGSVEETGDISGETGDVSGETGGRIECRGTIDTGGQYTRGAQTHQSAAIADGR